MSMPHTLADILLAAADSHGDLPALAGATGPAITFAHLAATWRRLRGDLRALGVGRGDRVGIVLAQDVTAAVLATGLRLSAVLVPLRPDMSGHELDLLLPRLGLRVLIIPAGLPDPARDAAARHGIPILEAGWEGGRTAVSLSGEAAGPPQPDRPAEPDDDCSILRTSASTGRSKLVRQTHRGAASTVVVAMARQPVAPGDRTILALPIHAVFGLEKLTHSLVGGGLSVMLGSVQFEWDHIPGSIAAHRPTWLALTPQGLDRLIRSLPDDPPHSAGSLRYVITGGAPTPQRLLDEASARLGVPIVQAYGTSEAGAIAMNAPDVTTPAGVVGAPLIDLRIAGPDGREVAAGEPGQIHIRGASVTPGYLDDPNPLTPDGWWALNDRGLIDPQGRLHVLGRIDLTINRGGLNVDPFEVESTLLAHPAIADAAVFAVPSDALGSDVAAAVVLAPDAAASPREIRRWALDRLTAHKAPRFVLILDRLPRTPNGKIDRTALPGLFCDPSGPASPA